MQRLSQPVRGDWSALDAYLRDVNTQSTSVQGENSAPSDVPKQASTSDEKEQLVLSHLRLVVRIARQYSGFGLPLSDLIAEGNIALLRAAELYDPSFGTKFHNYASVWIRQRLHRALTKQARAVKIPLWRSQRLRKLTRLNDELSAELGHVPTEAELAERLGLSEERFAELRADRIEVLSLDASTDSEQTDGRSWIEDLADETTPTPDHSLDHSETVDEAIASLHDLDQRELEILALKHGLHPNGEMSYRQLAPQLGVSHEWVRRIGQYALVKARRAMDSVRGLPAPVRKARAAGVMARIRAFADRSSLPESKVQRLPVSLKRTSAKSLAGVPSPMAA